MSKSSYVKSPVCITERTTLPTTRKDVFDDSRNKCNCPRLEKLFQHTAVAPISGHHLCKKKGPLVRIVRLLELPSIHSSFHIVGDLLHDKKMFVHPHY